jgi:hypothetical protein
VKRTPLRRSTPMRRGRPMRQRSPKARDRGELDNSVHLAAVRLLPCCARALTVCYGAVSPHHDTAARGLGQKASDLRTMPMCFGHHRSFHDATGPFRGWTRDQRRTWQQECIDETLLLTAHP